MLAFLIHWLLSACALLLAAKIIPNFEVDSWPAAFLGALVLGLINAVVRPVMVILTIPLTILTLGLFLFVINALMLKFAAAIVPGVRVIGIGSTLLASILVSIFGALIRAVL